MAWHKAGLHQDEINYAKLYLDNTGAVIVAIDHDEIVTEINEKGCEVLGYSRDEIIGKNWFDNFVPAAVRDDLRTYFHKMMQGNARIERRENPVLTKGGGERIIVWYNILTRDETGHILGTMSSGEDVTDLRQIEEGLNNYRQRLEEVVAQRTTDMAAIQTQLALEIANRQKAEEGLLLRANILDKLAEAVLVLDLTGNIIYVNEAAGKIYGYGSKELISKNFRDLLPPQEMAFTKASLEELLRKREIETVHLRKDQSLMVVQMRSRILKITLGEFIVSIIHANTEQKQGKKRSSIVGPNYD